MKEIRKGDSELVGHARRELELAGLFTPNKENDYDGFIGKGTLALIKLFDDWCKDDPQKMQAVSSVFSYLIAGDLLSPPTNDPDEWEDFEIEGQTVKRIKRNIFFITRDDRKTWFNLRHDQKGICNDIKTGKPLEGVEDPNGKAEQTAQDQEGPADANNTGDGADTNEPTPIGDLAPGVGPEESVAEGSEKVEAGELNPGVEPEGEADQGEAEAPAKKPKSGKA